MKIALVSSFVPFINGGARFIVEWAEAHLREAGHQVERFYLPFWDEPSCLMDQIAAYRMMDMAQSCDRMITFRPPAHLIEHPDKIVWFIHHIRVFYDLWDTPYAGMPDTAKTRALRQALMDADANGLTSARKLYCNSRVVADRVQHFNKLSAEVLYPPIWAPERFRCEGYGDDVVVICRIEPHKRQSLLIDAMEYTRTPVRVHLCGTAANPAYGSMMAADIARRGLGAKVIFENRWITEEEKADLLADALAVAYLPADEDSYGYPSIEGAHAKKAVLTTTDSGGVLELVQHGRNGFVEAPDPRALAARLDEWYLDRAMARRMGEENFARIEELGITWKRVIAALTQ
jgi:glycosyltransferase involved in cell wall biosynthesis